MATWRDGKTTAQRGYGGRWQRARVHFLRAHPLCCYCEREGRFTAATVVDHIRPHRGDLALFWNWDNLQPLCESHHNTKTMTEERGKKPRPRIGLDGWPIEG